jgi:hypothetical protein
LAATRTTTVALPLPDAGEGDAHAALLAAVQPHAECVRTSMRTSPPLAPTLVSPALTVKRHGAASCASWTVCSPITIVPRRETGSGFSPTR